MRSTIRRTSGRNCYLSLPDTIGVEFDPVDVPFIGGGQVMWETPITGLRAGASAYDGKLDTTYSLGGIAADTFDLRSKLGGSRRSSTRTTASSFAAEYGRSYTSETLGGMAASAIGEHGYGLAGYRWRPWFQTTLYYSLMYPTEVAHRSGQANQQHDAAVSVRFDITSHWLVKLEAHYLRGTAGLDSSLNNNVPLAILTNEWGLLAAKMTAYF